MDNIINFIFCLWNSYCKSFIVGSPGEGVKYFDDRSYPYLLLLKLSIISLFFLAFNVFLY